jgi:hypothetical protein
LEIRVTSEFELWERYRRGIPATLCTNRGAFFSQAGEPYVRATCSKIGIAISTVTPGVVSLRTRRYRSFTSFTQAYRDACDSVREVPSFKGMHEKILRAKDAPAALWQWGKRRAYDGD